MLPGDGHPDVVVVGGGIAGSALATVLARHGVQTTVLERQHVYQDRVRGEFMAHWGVEEAQRLGIADALFQAGGVFVKRYVPYDEIAPLQVAESLAADLGQMLPGVPGVYCAGHPAMCAALSTAAEAAGARYERGTGRVSVTVGRLPAVTYEVDGEQRQLSCRLVVGADGRTSSVRQQAGIVLHEAPSTHLVGGLLVDGVPSWPQDTFSIGTEGDAQYLIFPQGGDRLRLYLCIAPDQRDRFAGSDGPARFLETFGRLTCLPHAAAIGAARPIGPCATLGGEDTWTDAPFVYGVVLVGDAAGYNDPIIGQGLSIAIRDAGVLSDLLLAERDWSPERLAPYAEERRERMRRLRFRATVDAALHCTFGPEGAARRGRFYARLGSGKDPNLELVMATLLIGPHRAPPEVFDDVMHREILN